MQPKHPNIVYAPPPKRTHRKKERVEHPSLHTVIGALPPKEIEHKQRTAALARAEQIPSPYTETDQHRPEHKTYYQCHYDSACSVACSAKGPPRNKRIGSPPRTQE
jgi:hypothetical protein